MLSFTKLNEILFEICENAYNEGRRHQEEEDFPSIGMQFDKKFEDTETYKALKRIHINYA